MIVVLAAALSVVLAAGSSSIEFSASEPPVVISFLKSTDPQYT